MGWYYRTPQMFPAVYLSTLRNAAASPDIPQVLGSGTIADIKVLAEKFRWFRWCIREHPTAMMELTNILENYDIRASTEIHGAGAIIYITAKPTKISEFIRLNPDLSAEVLSECQ